MVEVSTQCSEGSPSYPDRIRHPVVHRCIEHRLGSTLECIDGVRCMDNNRENTPHQCTRVRSHTQNHAPLAAETYGFDSPGCVRQLHCSVLHQQTGRNTGNTTVRTDQETTHHVSGQPNSASGTTHHWEIKRPCRHTVAPFPDVRYRMVSTSICHPGIDSGMGNPIIRSVCNEVESQTSPICVPRSRSNSHGSRCSVNELEDTVGIRIPTTNSVTTGTRESQTGPVRTDPHCPKLAPAIWFPLLLGMLVQSPLRIPNIPRLLSQPRGQIHRDPSNLQLHAWRVSGMPSAAEAFRSTFPPVSVDPSESLLWRSISPNAESSLLGVSYNTLIHSRLLRV